MHLLLEVQIGVQDRPASAPPPSTHPYSPGSDRTNPKRLSFTPELMKLELQNLNYKATYPKTEPRSSTSDPTSPIASANGRRQGVDFFTRLVHRASSRRGPSPIRVSPIHLIILKKKTEFARFVYVAQ